MKKFCTMAWRAHIASKATIAPAHSRVLRAVSRELALRQHCGLCTPLRRHTPLLTALLRLLSTECLGAGDVAGIHLRGDAGRKVQ